MATVRTNTAAQDVLTIPQTTLTGTGSFTVANIDSTVMGYAISINEINWSYTGGPALHFTLSCSYDGGQSWQYLTDDTIQDEPIPAVKTFPANQFRVTASLDPQVGNTKRRFKVDYEAFKSVTISGAVQTLT